MLLADAQLVAEVARVHRIAPRLTNAESVARGAVLIADIAGLDREVVASAASLLLDPPLPTLTRQPLQVVAKLDVVLGGSGVPREPDQLVTLAGMLTHTPPTGIGADVLGLTHGALDNGLVVGLIVSRLAAMASGLDPKGLCVPEVFYNRHRARFFQALSSYAGDAQELYGLYEEAMFAGAREAEGIARE